MDRYVYCIGTSSYEESVSLPSGVYATLEGAMASVELRAGEEWEHRPDDDEWWLWRGFDDLAYVIGRYSVISSDS